MKFVHRLLFYRDLSDISLKLLISRALDCTKCPIKWNLTVQVESSMN